MAAYELVFRKSVAKELRSLPKRDLQRVLSRIDTLADEPRPAGAEKLSGRELYRIRQGQYRIVYEIADQRLIVTVVRVGHRRDIYRGI
jgi:mRNA interferase RelE/StbE